MPGIRILAQKSVNFLNHYFFFVIQSKGFHDHHRPSTKSSATSLKRKGHAKRASVASKMLPSQTSIEQCFKTEQAELRPAFSFDPSGHPPGTYWWDQNEVHMMQPLNGKANQIKNYLDIHFPEMSKNNVVILGL